LKVNNLRVFDNTLEGQMLLNYLKVQGLSLKSDKEENREKEEKKLLEETLCLKQLVESLLSEDNEVDLSYFIIGLALSGVYGVKKGRDFLSFYSNSKYTANGSIIISFNDLPLNPSSTSNNGFIIFLYKRYKQLIS